MNTDNNLVARRRLMLLISLKLIMRLFFDLISIIGLTKNDKELEIFILRQQVRILQLIV
jgi:hypothetical protein